jgi:hypothetical protein
MRLRIQNQKITEVESVVAEHDGRKPMDAKLRRPNSLGCPKKEVPEELVRISSVYRRNREDHEQNRAMAR